MFFTVALVCLICTSCFLYEEKVIVAEAEEIMTRTIVDSSDLVNVVTEAPYKLALVRVALFMFLHYFSRVRAK